MSSAIGALVKTLSDTRWGPTRADQHMAPETVDPALLTVVVSHSERRIKLYAILSGIRLNDACAVTVCAASNFRNLKINTVNFYYNNCEH